MIIIHKDSNNLFSVIDGDWFADGLGWDEMLGCIAKITMPENSPKRPYMRSFTEEYFNKLNDITKD